MQERPEKMSRKEGNARLKDVESHVISSLEIEPILKFSFQLRIMPAVKLMASSLHNQSLCRLVKVSFRMKIFKQDFEKIKCSYLGLRLPYMNVTV